MVLSFSYEWALFCFCQLTHCWFLTLRSIPTNVFGLTCSMCSVRMCKCFHASTSSAGISFFLFPFVKNSLFWSGTLPTSMTFRMERCASSPLTFSSREAGLPLKQVKLYILCRQEKKHGMCCTGHHTLVLFIMFGAADISVAFKLPCFLLVCPVHELHSEAQKYRYNSKKSWPRMKLEWASVGMCFLP